MTEDTRAADPTAGPVYRLDPDCTPDDIEVGAYYHAEVDGTVAYGMFVELAPAISGLVHESTFDDDYSTGDELVVELTEIRDNGDLSFRPVDIDDPETERISHDYEPIAVSAIDESEGAIIHVEAEVVQINQTGGPTLFHLTDGTGVVPAAAFESAGVRAFPDVSDGDLVHVVGRVERGSHGLQIEVDGLDPLEGDAATTAQDRIDEALDETATPASVEPLVDWSALAAHSQDLTAVARRLRRAVLQGRPVLVRHHADTDGMCASLPLAMALERFVASTHWRPEAARHLVRRLPSKAPYYEMEDVTRDLNRALENRARHGQRLPIVVLIDNGSTTEDVPAFEHLDAYDIPVIAIDHHHPDPDDVAPYLVEHVNPYLHGEDYRVTAGMLCVEVARMIAPELTADVQHVPAVAGLADRSSANAMTDYLALADESGFEQADLHEIGDAMDYAAHWLRYRSGDGVVADLLGLTDAPDRRDSLVDHLAGLADRDIEAQLDDALAHVESERLSNGVRLSRLDVDRHAHRFTYPAPGTTTGAVHDHIVSEHDEPAVTVGIGPDFAVLRSDGVRLDIPDIVAELNAELAGAGVSGGGHLVVGSIRFVEGMREPVLDALVERIAAATIDESLGTAAPRAYGDRAD